VLQHKGFRLSLIGAAIFFVSLALLAVMPPVGPLIGLTLGGVLVWAGLMWTLFGYYSTPEDHQST
jgi:hypothetical protein